MTTKNYYWEGPSHERCALSFSQQIVARSISRAFLQASNNFKLANIDVLSLTDYVHIDSTYASLHSPGQCSNESETRLERTQQECPLRHTMTR